MLRNLKPTTWEYVVHCEDKKGQQFLLKSIGKFSTPDKAVTFVSENGRDWEFFDKFTVCEKGNTARRAITELWNNKEK